MKFAYQCVVIGYPFSPEGTHFASVAVVFLPVFSSIETMSRKEIYIIKTGSHIVMRKLIRENIHL